MTTSLASLPKGYEFPPATFSLTREWVAEYVTAVGDEAIGALSDGFVPPMALATQSIRALIEASPLPDGALHAGQELSFKRAVRIGEALTANARIVSRGERAGWVLMSVDFNVLAGGDSVMTGRGTITFPVDAS
ncbi:MAG: MaoC family dehydratase [Chloroflexota bacterium]